MFVDILFVICLTMKYQYSQWHYCIHMCINYVGLAIIRLRYLVFIPLNTGMSESEYPSTFNFTSNTTKVCSDL